MKIDSDVKRLEKTLRLINEEEMRLLEEFDKNIYEILGDSFVPILKHYEKNPPAGEVILFKLNGKQIKVPKHFLFNFHASYYGNPDLKQQFLSKLSAWFSSKTKDIIKKIKDPDNYEELMKNLPESFALSSLALTAFHRRDKMYLRDVQKMAAINISEGNISELSTGEGKTLSAVLPLYLFALRGKGSHLITANSYLAKRDYEETRQIFEGLGLSVGYLPEDINEQAIIEGLNPKSLTMKQKYDLQQKVFKLKQKAYQSEITYGSKATFAFDYLRDCSMQKLEDMIQRTDKPGFAVIDEVDDCLVDDALTPYRIAGNPKTYSNGMTIDDLAVMYQEDPLKLSNDALKLGIKSSRLSYDEARFLTTTLFDDEILQDDAVYLETAFNFFNLQKVGEVNPQDFHSLFEPDKFDLTAIEAKYGILCSKGLKQYKITDRCLEEFLKYSYLSFQINSKVILVESQLLRDKNYQDKRDYYRDDFTGKIRLTTQGANKILRDKNYPLISDDFERYLSNTNKETSILTHLFNQVITAQLLMERDQDYSINVKTGDGFRREILPVKNGRMIEGSKFANGLHQALEIKEEFLREERSRETITVSSITQKDFYQRYDLYSGMTGTSSKKVFSEIYDKHTVSIPKNRPYEYYRKKKGKEPKQVVKKEVEFALNRNEKFSLIMSSIYASLKTEQPVLLVVSNVAEINLLKELFSRLNIKHQVLDLHANKEEEAFILAQAGLPGMVTISTDMAGRGTDIKVGGDRDTIIEILKERHIRKIEKQSKQSLPFSSADHDKLRKKVEATYLENGGLWTKAEEAKQKSRLEERGLKVISSGYFKVERTDRQLEGRTGRNGEGGITERYASLEDLTRLGIEIGKVEEEFKKSPKRKDGSLVLNTAFKRRLTQSILLRQSNNEGNIKENILYTQQVNKYSVELIEEYRDKRRNILSGKESRGKEVMEVLELAVDAVIADHLYEPSKVDLLIKSNNSELDDLLLEIKEIFGVTLNRSIIEKYNLTPKSLRAVLLSQAAKKISGNKELIDKIILGQNDFMIANIPSLVEESQDYKGIMSIAQGFEGQIDPLTSMRFVENRELLIVQSCKTAVKRGIGEGLKPADFAKREARKDSKGGFVISKIGEEVEPVDKKEMSLLEKIKLFRKNQQSKKANKETEERKVSGSSKK